MNLGPVEVESGLAFFEGHVDRTATLARLDEIMAGIDRPTLMVTHFVVISAVTVLVSAAARRWCTTQKPNKAGVWRSINLQAVIRQRPL